jgi:ribosomal protein S18 acetylase RimI-like enzyme
MRAARADLVIAIDEEAGDVTRLDARDGSPLPGHAVLPRCHGRGLGRDLIDRELSALRDVGSPGAHWGVDERNLRAIGVLRTPTLRTSRDARGVLFVPAL